MEAQTFRIKLFGLLAEQAGTDNVVCTCLPHRNDLLNTLFERFPLWKNQRLLLAVNHNVVFDNLLLQPHDELALMPPFSGG